MGRPLSRPCFDVVAEITSHTNGSERSAEVLCRNGSAPGLALPVPLLFATLFAFYPHDRIPPRMADFPIAPERAYPEPQGRGCPSSFCFDRNHLRIAHRIPCRTISGTATSKLRGWFSPKAIRLSRSIESVVPQADPTTGGPARCDPQVCDRCGRNEWPRLAMQERSPEADGALDALLREC